MDTSRLDQAVKDIKSSRSILSIEDMNMLKSLTK
jgi:hypothetical protein